MNTTRSLALAATSLLLAACAGDLPRSANPPNSHLAQSAETLEENTRALAERSDAMDRIFADDAHELQRHAYDFRMAAESANSSNAELKADFDQLTRSYQTLRSDAQQRHTEQASGALDLVSQAYDDVARQMGNTTSGAMPGA